MAKGRLLREFWVFIYDSANMYYKATYDSKGIPSISGSINPYPILYNPTNIKDFKPSFGTNKNYLSGTRSATNQLFFIKDGADILRYFDYLGSGYNQELYIKIIRYNKSDGISYLYYNGRFDFKPKKDDPIKGFSINIVDYGIWAILSQNDAVKYQINCSQTNPAAIPVLLDGITLKAKYTFQTIENSTFGSNTHPSFIMPISLINTDGDSSGIITNSQSYEQIPTGYDITYVQFSKNFSLQTVNPITITISGQFPIINTENLDLRFYFSIFTNFGQRFDFFNSIISYQQTKIAYINLTITLQEGEAVFFVGNGSNSFKFGIGNVYISTMTRTNASICYALRPLDLGQQIVAKATNGKFTLNSNHFTEFNKLVATCGNAIRNAPNAYISSSFEDWFKSYDLHYWLAFRIIDGQMWVELFKTVYDQNSTLFDIGILEEVAIEQATDYLFNEIEVGSPKQDYRHPSGRLEFNTTNKFSITQFNVKQVLSLISRYRLDGFGITFIQLDYQQQSTEDNSGDENVFLLDITDEKSTQGVEVENFTDITVNTEPLSPIITYPFNNDTILNNKPTIRGLCQPLTDVFVYVDGNLDGSTTSDVNGNWIYNIVTDLDYFVDTISSGSHLIEATFTDLSGTTTSRTVLLIDEVQPTVFLNLFDGQNIYNNKLLVSGLSENGNTYQVLLDGVNIGSVTPDNSNRWFFQLPVVSNGTHTIQVGTTILSFVVNAFTSLPIITSFFDGFDLVNNLPLVEGVGIPGTKVDLYLDYYQDVPLGTTFVDINGNWSIQLVPLFKTDGITVLTPIPEGNHIISTSLTIASAIVDITGYRLNRPPYSSISGVLDNTVFNTNLSDQKILRARMSFFKSVFYQQANTVIKFEFGDKNQQFSRTLAGVTIKENDNLKLSDFEDEPLFLPIILKSKVKTPLSFVETMDNFSSGGLIKGSYQGYDIYCLPIGEMTVNDVTNDLQDWSLLVSVKTPLITLLKLSTPGITFNIMNNALFRSDYNMLHFVQYDYQLDSKYSEAELYQDWFENRNQNWRDNPFYIQKVQQSEGIVKDQIITNGLSGTITLNMYKCSDASLYNSYNYSVVVPQPIQFPDIVQEASIDYSSIPEGDYFFVMFVENNPALISERIRVAEKHLGTILIDSVNSTNKTGCMFSTGFRSVLRIEGHLGKLQTAIENIINEDEIGDFQMIHSVSTRKRPILIGDPNGTPDYLYLKVAPMLSLDTMKIEQLEYVLDKDASFEPLDKVVGHPMYHYSIDVRLKENNEGATFDVGESNFKNGVTLVVDAGAFGLGGGGLVNIDIENE